MLKRTFDVAASFFGLILTGPILIPTMIAIWLQDFHSPFYIASRVGKHGDIFKMVKLRSMVADADKTGVDSTSAEDARITAVGRFIRRYKLDELSQLWNVLKGDMSLVGPRPQVERDVAIYKVRPGITDLASIVFSDEGDILAGSDDPDLKYNQVIRPWKSRLGILYVEKRSLLLDLQIIGLTVIAIVSCPFALRGVQRLLEKLGADEQLRNVAKRDHPLYPYPPPGADKVVTTREPLSVSVQSSFG